MGFDYLLYINKSLYLLEQNIFFFFINDTNDDTNDTNDTNDNSTFFT